MRRVLSWFVVAGVLCIGACQPVETEPPGDVDDQAGAEPSPAAQEAETPKAQSWDFEDADVGSLPDENNYYVARMNPLELNLRVYKVVDGKRTQLASADVDASDEELDSGHPLLNQWHTIRIVHRGDQIQCYLNGELRLECEGSSIPQAGKIGLWAKADAVTSFDKLSVAAP